MEVKDLLAQAKVGVAPFGFSAPESVRKRAEAMQAHYGTNRSELLCALVNAHYHALVSSGEMTPDTITLAGDEK